MNQIIETYKNNSCTVTVYIYYNLRLKNLIEKAHDQSVISAHG